MFINFRVKWSCFGILWWILFIAFEECDFIGFVIRDFLLFDRLELVFVGWE